MSPTPDISDLLDAASLNSPLTKEPEVDSGVTSEKSGTSLDTSTNSSTSSNSERYLNLPRENFLEWDEYFMAIAFLSAQRSKDPATQVGACIVNSDKRIVGIGYNGMPRGCKDGHLPWGKSSSCELENKYMYVCHAEMNAIMNKNSASVDGCSIYVALFPCNECSKLIIQSGIKEVIYFSDKHKDKKSTIASKIFKMSSSRRHQDWPVESKVYVGGLRSDCTKTDIEDAFEKYGRILNVWIAQRPPGFGFVLFEDAMDAKDAARELDGGKVAGHRVKVEMARDFGGGGAGGDRDRDRDRGRRSPPPRRRSRTPERKRRDRSDERRR